MSQGAILLPGSPLTGSAMVGDINATTQALVSQFSGTTAPTLGPGAASALVEGQYWLDTSLSPNVLRQWDGNNWCPVGLLDTVNHLATFPPSWRNLLYANGGLEIWQRASGISSSIAVLASTTQYTADRWYITTGANQASVVAAVTPGLVAASRTAAKITRNSGQTGTGAYTFGYPIDGNEIFNLIGNKVSISALVKAGANWSPASGTLNLDFYVGTGSPGKRGGGFTGETHVASATVNLSTSQQATMSAVSAAAVPVGSTQGEVQFTWTPVGTAGADDSITLDDVQLENGTFNSTFERIAFEAQLIFCKRHFWKTFSLGTTPAQNNGANTGELQGIAGKAGTATLLLAARHPVTMRVGSPVITTYNPSAANAQIRDETAPGDCSATATLQATTETLSLTATGNASTLVGNTIGVHLTADAGL